MRASLAVGALALGLAACGGSPPPPPVATARPTPSAKPATTSDAPPDEGNGCPDGMVVVPGGSGFIGSLEGQGQPDERKQFPHEQPEFCLDAREVSVGAYGECVKNGICLPLAKDVQLTGDDKSAEARSALCSAHGKNPELPANCVAYEEAAKFCAWRGARLPSEFEFEYVATSGGDKLIYPWGSAVPDSSRLCWKQPKGPCAVGSKPAGAFGIFDVVGNVAEWTSTPYGPYPDPPDSAPTLSVRGASFLTQAVDDARGRRRFHRDPATRDVDLGFRCAKTR